MPCTEGNTKAGPLVIKYKAADNGSRPILPCDATNPTWLSPHIWLDHPSDTSFDQVTAKVGVENTIMVKVTNISQAPISNVNVEAYITDYTAGVGPASAIPGTSKFTGFVSSVPAGINNGVNVNCSPKWTPTAAQLAINGGHVCLFANCFGDAPETGQSVDFMATPLPFCCDSHLAQRNMQIKPMSLRGMGAAMVPFFVANPSERKAQELVLRLRATALTGVLDQGTIQILETSPFIRREGDARRPRLFLIDEQLPKPVPVKVSPRKEYYYRFFPREYNPGERVKLKLRPKERTPVQLVLQLDRREPIGSVRAFDIALTTPKGELMGGVRLVTITTP